MSVKNNLWRVLAGILAAALVAAAGVLIGTEVGRYEGERRMRTRHAKKTQGVLKQMGTVAIGDTLPDHRFEDMNRNLVWWGDLLKGRTIVSFFDPGCEACLDEVDNLLDAITRPEDARYFLFISSYDRDSLALLAQAYGIASQILYDENGAFGKNLAVFTFPFNLTVTTAREVYEVSTDPITTDEFRLLIMKNHQTEAGD